jgi:Zn-dependent peptidase ImmA (M78 family)
MGDDILIILSVGFTLFCAGGLINEFIKDFQQQNISKRQKLKPRRPQYSRLIKEIVRWSGPLLLDEGIKRYPHVKVSYRKCKGADGYYSPKSKTVEVLVNKSVDVNRIVFVTLHELAHYLQHQTDPEFRNYDYYHYDTNPFEIEANRFATDYQKSCLKHLESIGYI